MKRIVNLSHFSDWTMLLTLLKLSTDVKQRLALKSTEAKTWETMAEAVGNATKKCFMQTVYVMRILAVRETRKKCLQNNCSPLLSML